MSIITTTERNVSAVLDRNRQPYDHRGRRVARDCVHCGNGRLQWEGAGWWRCDGLADPGRDDLPLEACTYQHQDGTEVQP